MASENSSSNNSLFIILFLIFLVILSSTGLLIYLIVKPAPKISKLNDIDIQNISQKLLKTLDLKNKNCSNDDFIEIIKEAISTENVCQTEEARWTKMVTNAVEDTKNACAIKPTNTTNTANTSNHNNNYQGDRPGFGFSESTPDNKKVNVVVDNDGYTVLTDKMKNISDPDKPSPTTKSLKGKQTNVENSLASRITNFTKYDTYWDDITKQES